MSFLTRLKFRTKINLGIAGIVVLIALVLSLFVSQMAARALIEENKKRGSALVQNLSGRAVDPLLATDFLRLKNMVDELQQLGDDIEYAFVLDRQGNVLVHTFQRGFPVDLVTANPVDDTRQVTIQLISTGFERIYDYAAPVLLSGNRLGTVRLGISRGRIQHTVNQFVLGIFGISGGVLLGAVVLSTIFARRITQRIAMLRNYAEEVVRGNLDLQTGPTLDSECWEIMECDKEQCPAYGDRRRRCWYLAGTLCPNCDQRPYPHKLETCQTCPVYIRNVGDEIQELSETFDVMALTLKNHIQELKDAEQNLTRQQQLLRTVLDVTPDLVSLLDENLVYRQPNKAFASSLGMSVDQVVGQTDEDLFPAEIAAQRTEKNRLVLETGKKTEMESTRENMQGTRWYHTVIIPVTDTDGRVAGILRTARDITELKSYQEQLIQSQKMESLGKLAGGVAHEINTPLGIILGYAQLLLEDFSRNSQTYADLKIIEKQAKVCRKIVADLLGFSRQHEREMGFMDLNESIEEVISLVQHSFYLDNATIETDLDSNLPAIVGDREKLKQVWINLLDNALDAMPTGGKVEVRTRSVDAGQRVEISFADTGTGISTEDQKKIFDPFFSTKEVGKGTGLGLSVSFGIIEAHGGLINFSSPCPPEYKPDVDPALAGPGTLFLIRLPLSGCDDSVQDTERIEQ